MPLVWMAIFVAIIGLYTSPWFWLLAVPLWAIMAALIKHDDKAFRIIGLWLMTKAFNRGRRYWGAVSFALVDYRRKN